jgi:signal transduction histidine kinase
VQILDVDAPPQEQNASFQINTEVLLIAAVVVVVVVISGTLLVLRKRKHRLAP